MKYLKYIIFAIILYPSGEDVFAQSKKDSITVIFSIQNLNLDLYLDTIPIIKEKKTRVYFYNNTMYYNERKIYEFKKTEYYMEFISLCRNNSRYIYIYPKYKDRSGPYIWYGLGVLFEITDEGITIKSGYDYYDILDIKRLFSQDNHKIIRRIKQDVPGPLKDDWGEYWYIGVIKTVRGEESFSETYLLWRSVEDCIAGRGEDCRRL